MYIAISVANPGNGIVIMQEKHLKILVIVLYSTITRSCSGWLCAQAIVEGLDLEQN